MENMLTKNSSKISRKRKTTYATDLDAWKTLEFNRKFRASIDVAQLDLIEDLDDEFFKISYELVQQLVPLNCFMASKMKVFVDIVARLHAHYLKEMRTAQELKQTINAANAKLRLAIEVTEESSYVMEALRLSLEEAWRTIDASEYRESLLGETHGKAAIKDQPSEALDNLTYWKNPKELYVRSFVYRERDRLAVELREYQKRLELNRTYSATVEAINEQNIETIRQQHLHMKQIEAEQSNEEQKYRMAIEQLEGKIEAQRKDIKCLTHMNRELREFERKYNESLSIVGRLKQAIERLSHDNYNLTKTNHRIDEAYRVRQITLANLEITNKAMNIEKAELLQVIRRLKCERKSKDFLFNQLNRRFHLLSKKNTNLMSQKNCLNNKVTGLEKNMLALTTKLNEIVHIKDEAVRVQTKLQADLKHQSDVIASLRYDLAVQRSHSQDVQIMLDRANRTLDEKDVRIHKINKEKHDVQLENSELSRSIEILEAKIVVKTEKIKELKQKLDAKQQSYMKAKKQLEIIHTEKTLVENSMELCGRDRQKLQSLNGKLSFQINQMCKQLATNEKEMNLQSKRIDHLDNLLKHKQNEIHSRERQVEQIRAELAELKVLNQQLHCTIDRDTMRFKQVSIRLEEVNKEKMVIGQQIVRRNCELHALQEKLSMLQMAMSRGTTQYNQRVEDIRLLKAEISNLRMSNACMQRSITNTANMRQEVVRIERQLVRERLNVTAFTEEMKYPYRIHRWRVLVGRDPSKYQLIRKIQVLLKRNIKLSVERLNMEHKVQDMQKLCDAFKRQVQHMPDPSIVQRLWVQKRINRRQSRKVNAMKAELAINEIDRQSRDILLKEYQTAISKGYLASNQIVTTLIGVLDVSRPEVPAATVFQMTPRNSNLSLDVKEVRSAYVLK
ncbi:PREDICTED: cilia- and flagella-associated protein 58 [Drosophila arizonae]|uniref:Cilia- and flagella-associated protein 58 n=1 Tax=Drosophila arizonae TaxID=7263 RepID=A0ABM1Q1N7_DROAR|nr:PREDICTED: cilia- and flagella-associated protein 58 [Drosophila arizonae]